MNAGDKVVVVNPITYAITGRGTLKSTKVVDDFYLRVSNGGSTEKLLLAGTVLPDTADVVRELAELEAAYAQLHQAELALQGRLLRLRNQACC